MARRRKKPKGVEAYSEPIGPRLDPARKDRKLADLRAAGHPSTRRGRMTSMFRQIKPGLPALAGLGAVAGGYGVASGISGLRDRPLIERAQEDLRRTSRQQLIDQLSMSARQTSLDNSIQTNLQRLEREAPDLYMRISVGRRLPQGAVVLGGEKRTDLLEELGRSMADGQFSM